MLAKGQAGGYKCEWHDLLLQIVSELAHDWESDLGLNLHFALCFLGLIAFSFSVLGTLLLCFPRWQPFNYWVLAWIPPFLRCLPCAPSLGQIFLLQLQASIASFSNMHPSQMRARICLVFCCFFFLFFFITVSLASNSSSYLTGF